MPPPKLSPTSKSIIRQLPDIDACETPLLKSLWALKASKLSSGDSEFITATAISDLLLRSDVNLPPTRVHRALARAGDAVARRGHGQGTEFRIVRPGEQFLERRAGHRGPLTFYVTGKAPWSDRRFVVKQALKQSTGDVYILDKYFGMESLDFLQDFQKTRRIRFLTAHPSKKVGQLQREVARFEEGISKFRV